MKHELALFVARVFDCLPPPQAFVSVVYPFGQTMDNEISVIQRVSYLPGFIMIPDNGSGTEFCGYLGADHWTDLLVENGVSRAAIQKLFIPAATNSNTFVEAVALVKKAKEEHWKNCTVVAPSFHLPRVFLSMISAALRSYPELKIWAYPGVSQSWSENVVHSQGITRGTRSEIMLGEFERIERYQEKGDLVSFGDAFQYLDQR